jgi:hypothetical protein
MAVFAWIVVFEHHYSPYLYGDSWHLFVSLERRQSYPNKDCPKIASKAKKYTNRALRKDTWFGSKST